MDENVIMSNVKFQAEWISKLLEEITLHCDKTESKAILQTCSAYHFKHLNMEEVLRKYIGDLDGFLDFISTEWGWKITYNKKENEIIADENKNYCVCPIVKNSKQKFSNVLCHCSEGFAQRMFSTVSEKDVTATVIQSILSGDNRCIYRIQLHEKTL